MAYDPASAILIIMALISLRLRGRLMRWCVAEPKKLGLICLLAFGATAIHFTRTVVMAPFALLSLWVYVLYLNQDIAQPENGRRTRHLLLAACFSLPMIVAYPDAFYMEKPGIGHFWFIDVFNKGFLFLVQPLLDTFIDVYEVFIIEIFQPLLLLFDADSNFEMNKVRPVVLPYLTPTILFISDYLTAFHFLLVVFLISVLNHIARPLLVDSPPAPKMFSTPLPKKALGGLLACFAGATLWHENIVLGVLWRWSSAYFVIHAIGAALILTRTSSQATRARSVLWMTVLICLAHPKLFLLFGVLAALQSLFQFTPDGLATGPQESFFAAETERGTSKFMGIFRISVFAMVFLPLLFVNLVTQPYLGHYDTAWRKLRKQTGRETEALHDPRQKADKAVAPSEVHIPAITGGSFLMDAYEYPNLKHSMPKTGIEPSEAMGICEILGKHLCTIDEWFQACSEDGEYRYMPTPVPFSLEEDVAAGTWPLGMKKLRKACNVNSVELARSGEFPQCRGHRPVYDLVGNIFEWVHIPDSGGFWALMGSYYKYDDKWTTSCLFQTLVHEGQLSMIDLPSTGFRCCRLGETGTD